MLDVNFNNLGDVTIFRCAGRIAFPDAGILRTAVLTQQPAVVVLDLAEVRTVDASGLGILVSLRTWAGTTGTRLMLMNLKPRLEFLLELTNLRPLFEICSVRDMLALMCHASEQRHLVEAELSVASLGDIPLNIATSSMQEHG
jgi:anti-sigma B factor antagonist